MNSPDSLNAACARDTSIFSGTTMPRTAVASTLRRSISARAPPIIPFDVLPMPPGHLERPAILRYGAK